jgi:hypothetical protein
VDQSCLDRANDMLSICARPPRSRNAASRILAVATRKCVCPWVPLGRAKEKSHHAAQIANMRRSVLTEVSLDPSRYLSLLTHRTGSKVQQNPETFDCRE